MCQLLGMNCNVPTDICFSFEGFHARGGETDDHRDGWGIAFFDGNGCRMFIDSKATIESPVADLVRHYPIHSTNVIAHIRKATQGRIALENCHPFMRELWGRYWIFAHNGDLKDFCHETPEIYRPVGNTDSERAFCRILDGLHQRFPSGRPAQAELHAALGDITTEIAAYGVFNYLLSDGTTLFAHCSTDLSYIVRRAPFAAAHLADRDVTVDFSHLAGANDRVAVIATQPLTDNECWTRLLPAQLLAFRDGAAVTLPPG